MTSSELSKILLENTLEVHEISRLTHQYKSPSKIFFSFFVGMEASAELDVFKI